MGGGPPHPPPTKVYPAGRSVSVTVSGRLCPPRVRSFCLRHVEKRGIECDRDSFLVSRKARQHVTNVLTVVVWRRELEGLVIERDWIEVSVGALWMVLVEDTIVRRIYQAPCVHPLWSVAVLARQRERPVALGVEASMSGGFDSTTLYSIASRRATNQQHYIQ